MNIKIHFQPGMRLARLRSLYPATTVIALITSLILMYIVHNESGALFRWPLAGFIGFLTFFNLETAKNGHLLSGRPYFIACITAFAALLVYYLNIPDNFGDELSPFWFFTLGLGTGLHFLATLMPTFIQPDSDIYINYNIRLFICWIQSSLYALLLYVSLLLALLALESLFGIKGNPNAPLTLFVLVAGVFQTLYFLSEIPDASTTESLKAPLPVLRFITVYGGIPVIVLYSVILYAYTFKTMLASQNPVDWSKAMTLWYLGVGILVYLSSKYFENFQDHAWMKFFRKWFFFASVVPAGLLWFVIIKSIDTKGLNDQLYFTIMLAVWSGMIVILSLIKKIKSRKFISVSGIIICAFAFTSHPWSMYQLPVTWQQKKLIESLSQAGVIQDEIIKTDSTFTLQDSNYFISEKLYFLESRNALNFLKVYDPNEILGPKTDTLRAEKVIKKLGITTYLELDENQSWQIFNRHADSIDIRSFDVMYPLALETDEPLPDYGVISDKYGNFTLRLKGYARDTLILGDSLEILIKQSDKEPIMRFENKNGEYCIILQNATGEKQKDSLIITSMRGWALYKAK
jgi:hypothetical protein